MILYCFKCTAFTMQTNSLFTVLSEQLLVHLAKSSIRFSSSSQLVFSPGFHCVQAHNTLKFLYS